MPQKWYDCIEKVSKKGGVNPYAICSPYRGGGHSQSRVYTGVRGGKYRLVNGRKVYLKKKTSAKE